MTTRELYLPVLDWFFTEVDNKLGLPENIAKESWADMSYDALMDRLSDETDELYFAVDNFLIADEDKKNTRRDVVIKEAADVAAFAMMIADRVRKDI
jgi:hypothetical protein